MTPNPVTTGLVIWRNPTLQLPYPEQRVFIMLDPHKWRGSMVESVESIEIVCGCYYSPFIENWDEYGYGSQRWRIDPIKEDEHQDYSEHFAIAWIPAEEMPLPDYKEQP